MAYVTWKTGKKSTAWEFALLLPLDVLELPDVCYASPWSQKTHYCQLQMTDSLLEMAN